MGDSEWNYYKNSQAAYNPVASLNQKDDRATSKALVGNLELDYKVHGLEDLRLHVSGGMDFLPVNKKRAGVRIPLKTTTMVIQVLMRRISTIFL